MDDPIEFLAVWFNGLPEDQQEDVVRFLYEEKAELVVQRLREGMYSGPLPAPSVARCPTCGQPL
jgi:hypothetical protein